MVEPRAAIGSHIASFPSVLATLVERPCSKYFSNKMKGKYCCYSENLPSKSPALGYTALG